MTTPTLPPFHQKIFPHAKSAKPAKGISLAKSNPSRLERDGIGTWRPLREPSAFTLVELMAVITVIGILAGLTLGAAGAVRRHGATSQAKAEITALQAACDRYFADFGAYPTTNSMPDPGSSLDVDPTSANYKAGSGVLFTALFGTNQYNKAPASKRYFEPKPSMVSSTNGANPYFADPWGYSYGYNSNGTNAPLIWSTAGQTKGGANTNKWITSWPKN
jgi:prepilin-type N-terminal cleavage/methylation domain-containing protein